MRLQKKLHTYHKRFTHTNRNECMNWKIENFFWRNFVSFSHNDISSTRLPDVSDYANKIVKCTFYVLTLRMQSFEILISFHLLSFLLIFFSTTVYELKLSKSQNESKISAPEDSRNTHGAYYITQTHKRCVWVKLFLWTNSTEHWACISSWLFRLDLFPVPGIFVRKFYYLFYIFARKTESRTNSTTTTCEHHIDRREWRQIELVNV